MNDDSTLSLFWLVNYNLSERAVNRADVQLSVHNQSTFFFTTSPLIIWSVSIVIALSTHSAHYAPNVLI